MLIKRFSEWIQKKMKLDSSTYKPPYFNEREIWWCSLGENVGNEINGKNEHFRRPILIMKKLDAYSFLAVPLTTTDKTGSWYVSITHNDRVSTAVISQMRHLDYRRLDKKLATLDEQDFQRVKDALLEFLR